MTSLHLILLLTISAWAGVVAFVLPLPGRRSADGAAAGRSSRRQKSSELLRWHGSSSSSSWWDNLFSAPDQDSAGVDRKLQYPEQYPATYELSNVVVTSDTVDAKLVRPLLKQTQLESRQLRLAYNANSSSSSSSKNQGGGGWNAAAFHRAVDGQGAAVILAKAVGSQDWFGGYNPKGWASTGGARPSVAAFLFYTALDNNNNNKGSVLQKLCKVGGGGLACAKDDPDTGIWLGADGLVIPLLAAATAGGATAAASDEEGRVARRAQSKLGTYFERGPENLSSIFPTGSVELAELKILVGVYEPGEGIPYAGGVLDMTSG